MIDLLSAYSVEQILIFTIWEDNLGFITRRF